MCVTLKKIQKLVQSGEMIGEALVPVRIDCHIFSIIAKSFQLWTCSRINDVINFRNNLVNIGDKIDYAQRKNENLADLV